MYIFNCSLSEPVSEFLLLQLTFLRKLWKIQIVTCFSRFLIHLCRELAYSIRGDVGGMAVEVNLSHQYSIAFGCRVTDGAEGQCDKMVPDVEL